MEDELFDVLLGCVDRLLKDKIQLWIDHMNTKESPFWMKNYLSLDVALSVMLFAMLRYKEEGEKRFRKLFHVLTKEHETIINLNLWRHLSGKEHKHPLDLIQAYSEARRKFILSKKDLINKLNQS